MCSHAVLWFILLFVLGVLVYYYLALSAFFPYSDQVSFHFQLEIKDISLHCDHNNDEEDFAYEMYKIPEFWAGH